MREQLAIGTMMCGVLLAIESHAIAAPSAKVIIDTDIAEDVDDVGALAVLHALADRGEAEILACMISSNNPWSAQCADAINSWYGRPDIPLGRVSEFEASQPTQRVIPSRYTETIAAEFPHDGAMADEVPTAVSLYRQLLATQPDQSVTIVTVGFLTNLAAQLDSPPDQFSSLGGRELVRQKVKQWVCMGGIFPEGQSNEGHGEYNLRVTAAASRRAIHDWPTPIVFSGFEIGARVMTGSKLSRASADSPVRRGYELYNDLANRQSWDQTAVLFAVRGAADYWKLSPPGICRVPNGSSGRNEWSEVENGPHRYLIEHMPPEEVAEVIEALMTAPPAGGKSD